MSTTKGAIERDGKMFCEECDNDLSVKGSVKFVAHFDGAKTYGYTYNCNKCRNIIKQTFDRSPEDAAYWG